MRTEPTAYFTKDQATTRQPVEIYHIWQEGGAGSHWYYTSGDAAVDYDGHTYEPAPIKRDTVQFREGDEVSSLSITASDLTGPIATFISSNPVDLYWIEVRKFFRDQVTPTPLVLFIGQVKSVSMNGPEASVECVGFERMFNEPIPRFRYGPQCNWTLFDGRCGLTRSSYKVTGTVTIQADSRDLVLEVPPCPDMTMGILQWAWLKPHRPGGSSPTMKGPRSPSGSLSATWRPGIAWIFTQVVMGGWKRAGRSSSI